MSRSENSVENDAFKVYSADHVISLECLTQHKTTMHGKVSIAELPHVAESTLNGDGWVTFSLTFDLDHEGRMTVQGTLDATLPVECQRCCQPMELVLGASPRLVVVSEEEAEHLDGENEPLVLSSEPLQLGQLIEEEILLQIPLIPRHADEACEWIFKQQ